MKKIFKYGTGQSVPEGAIYLGTITQTHQENYDKVYVPCWYVWHYFLVEIEK